MSQRSFRISRDGILFGTGLAGIVWETIAENGDRPTLLVLFGAMVGLPAFLRTDEKKKATDIIAQAAALLADKAPTPASPPPPPPDVEQPAPAKDPEP